MSIESAITRIENYFHSHLEGELESQGNFGEDFDQILEEEQCSIIDLKFKAIESEDGSTESVVIE